jgi:uncharacterized LabA/DUF88 family protein
MSGDSDFIELVRHLKAEGVRVEISAVPKTTSKLLIEEADHFHALDKEFWFTLGPKRSKRKATQKKKKPNSAKSGNK